MSDFLIKSFAALTKQEKKAIEAAEAALAHSYSPYSKFEVGAALLLEDGSLITGSNQENMAYPSGICAERAALFAYGSGSNKAAIEYLAVIARHHGSAERASGAPCGGCRQVMLEYEIKQEQAFSVIFMKDEQFIITTSCKALLPFHFHLESPDE